MYNVKQITNNNIDTLPTEIKPGKEGLGIPYVILQAPIIVRFGYIVNSPKGIGYPIYYTINEQEQKVFIGETGIYETDSALELQVTNIKVPKEIPFCLDYIIKI